MASSSPPPSATPLKAASTGLRQAATRASTVGKMGSADWAGVPSSATSAPAEKARSLPASTMPRTAGSDSAASSACTMKRRSTRLRLFTGGWDRLTTATSPCMA